MNENKKKADDSELYIHEISDPKVLEFEKDDLIKGILYSEILGKPLCKRKERIRGWFWK